MQTTAYDPFSPGNRRTEVRTFYFSDLDRSRTFPCEIWYPATVQNSRQNKPTEYGSESDGSAIRGVVPLREQYPLILFSHSGGGNRCQSSFLCEHLASHGYVVAALDHSERVVPELQTAGAETTAQKAARWDAMIAARVPDIQFLLKTVLAEPNLSPMINPTQIGIAGHSFGGWTALAALDTEPRIRTAVALAPGGAVRHKPGILPLKLEFTRIPEVPTLYLAAEHDTSLPLADMRELFNRNPDPKRIVVLCRADHLHFMDDAASLHERIRKMVWTGDLAWLSQDMQPFDDLCPATHAQLFTRSLTLSHMDAFLKQNERAQQFLAGDLTRAFAARGVEVTT